MPHTLPNLPDFQRVIRIGRATLFFASLATLSLAICGCGGGNGAGTESTSADSASSGAADEDATTLALRRKTVPVVAPVVTPVVVPAGANATPYAGRAWFVDNNAGSDSAVGTTSAPWKTLSRASRQSLAAGDAVLLKCGGVWRESMTIGAAAAPAGGAILGAWGDCSATNRPVVSGADVVSGTPWTLATGMGGKPVYTAHWTQPVTVLYWNGAPLIRARYPNYGGIGHEFRLIDSVRSASTLVTQSTDAAVLSRLNLAGAKMFVRTNPWLVEPLDVSGVDANGAIKLQALGIYPPQPGEGYFVEGSLALLDAPGEWFYDSATAQLYVWTADGSSPATGLVETGQRPFGVKVSGITGTRVDQVAFEKQTQIGLHVLDSKQTVVTTVSSSNAGLSGILIEGTSPGQSSGTRVQASTIRNAGQNGISATSPSVTLTGNTIDGVGTGPAATGVSAGIYFDSVGGIVQQNNVTNSAFAGIVLSHATGVSVTGNSLTHACRRFTDCGAIYSGGAPGAAAPRAVISSNAIGQMVPNSEGAIGGATTLVAGIYLDEGSSGHDVTNNMINQIGVGINVHNSANHLLQNNHVWLADESSIRMHNSSATDTVRGNIVQDNELFATSRLVASVPSTAAPVVSTVYAQEWVHSSDATAMFRGTNPNVVRRNLAGTLTGRSSVAWSLTSGWSQRTLDATQWGAYATAETIKAVYAAQPFLVGAGGANLVQNSAFQSSSGSWLFWSPTPALAGSFKLGSCGVSGCGDLVLGGSTDFLMSNTFRMAFASPSALYQLKVRAQAIGSNAELTLAINRAGGDYAQLGAVLMNQPIGSDQETSLGVLFNPTSGDLARLNITGAAGGSVRLKDVTVAQVGTYELFSPAQESTLLANETAAAKSVDCPSAVLRTCVQSDLSGQLISWPVTLPANSSKIVLSADAKWKP